MKTIVCIVLLLEISFCFGQELFHRTLNSDNGLPSNKVHYVYEDSRGYIWFGTENGVCRWDSKNFVYYTIKDGLPNNEVLVIYEDSKGRIWFSTFSNELCYLYHDTIFNKKNDRRLEKISILKGGKLTEHKGEVYYFNFPSSMPEKFDVKTLENRKSGIKALASGSPLILFREKHFVSYSYEHNYYPISSLVIDSNFVGYYQWRMDFKDNRTDIIDYNSRQYFSLANDSILPFLYRHARRFFTYQYVIHDSSIHKYSRKKIEALHNKTCMPYAISKNESILLSGKFEGDLHSFYKLDSDLVFIYKNHIQVDNRRVLDFEYRLDYSQLLRNKIGVITEENFLLLNNTLVHNYSIQNKKQSSIHRIFLKNKKLYVLFLNGIVENLSGSNYKLPTQSRFYGLNMGAGNRIYLTTFEHIIDVNTSEILSSSFLHHYSHFKGFSYSSRHQLYTINNNDVGLFIQDLNKKVTKISDLHAYTTFIDSRDRLWVGTMNKLYMSKKFLPKVEGEREIRLNPSRDIFCSEIKEDSWGNLFFTTNDGIYVLDKEDRTYHLSDETLLSSNECVTLKLDSSTQNFVIATKNGVNQIHYVMTKNGLRFEVVNKFYKEDGLSSNEIKDVLIDGDSLWVATAKGLDLIMNKAYRPDSIRIPIHINKVYVNDSLWRLDTCYRLHHTQNNIKIDYSAIYYQRRDRLDIRYRLIKDGDTTMGILDNHILHLFSLASGDYILQIYAYDRDYPYIRSIDKTLYFIISPPYYKTWWFIGLLFVLALGVVVGFILYRNRKKLEQVKLVGELTKYKLQGLQHQMNPHFVFNSMSTIQDLILTAKNTDALDFISDFSQLMRSMLQNSRNELISLSQEIVFLRRYIELEQIRYAHSFDYAVHLEMDEDESNDIYIPTMMIQPLVENAIKHGVSNLKEHRGKITLHFKLTEDDNYLEVRIQDNGKGKSTSAKTKSHISTALQVIQERLLIYTKNELQGSYTIDYTLQGTTSVLVIPI